MFVRRGTFTDMVRRLRRRLLADRALGGSFAAAGLLQVLLVASGIVVARGLGAEDRGYLALLVVVSGICTLVGGLGLFTALTYYIAGDQDQARPIARSLLGPALAQVVVTVVAQAAVVFALVAHDPHRVKVAGLISLFLVPGILAYGYGEGILLGQQRFVAFNVLRVVPTGAYVILVLAVFVVGAADLVVVMAIWAGANLVGGLLALGAAVRGLPEPLEQHAVPSRRDMTVFGVKALLGSLSPIEVFRLDQAVVGLLLNPVALGLYVVAQAFTNLPRVIASSIGYIAYPRVAAQSDRGEARRLVLRYVLLAVGVCAFVVGLTELVLGPIVRTLFGGQFDGATPIARILLVGTFFSAVRRILTDGMKGLGHPGQGAVAELTSWAVIVPATAILLPLYGASGVALALTIAWGASLGVAIFLALAAERSARPALHTYRPRPERVLGFFESFASRRAVLSTLAWAVATVAAGSVAASSSIRTALAVLLASMAALVFFWARSRPAARRVNLRVRSTHPATDSNSAAFRSARGIYYLGLLFLALLTVRVLGQVTVSDVLFLMSMALCCAELVVLRRHVPVRLPLLLLLGMAVFTIGGVLSSFGSYSAFKSIAIVLRLIFLTVFWFWLGTVVLSRREHIQRAIGLWVASAALCGAAAIAQVALGASVIPNTTAIYGRSTGFTNQPNDLGGLCAIAFIPALMISARPGLSALRRSAGYVLLLCVAAGLLLSGSVGALIAATAATFVWFAFQRVSSRSLAAFAVLLASVVAITGVQVARGVPTPIDRFHRVTATSATGMGAGSIDSRIATYRAAERAIRKDPFVGVGLDLVSVTRPFGVVSYEYDVHNLVIGTWYKAGLFGLIGMLLSVFAILSTGRRTIDSSRSQLDDMTAVALLSSFIAFVVFAMGAPVIFSRYGWIPAALLLAFRGVQASDDRRSRSPSLRWARATEPRIGWNSHARADGSAANAGRN